MTLVELEQLLDATGFPVAYSHFSHNVPPPPYICYLEEDSNNFYADNSILQEAINVRIELYTAKKDLAAEGKVKDILKLNQINFETDELYIDSEKLFMKIFEVELR